MMEANSTDEEKLPPKPLSQRAEKRKSPPKEYIGESHSTCIYSTRPQLVSLSVFDQNF